MDGSEHHLEHNLRLLLEQVPAVLWSVDRQLRFTSSTGAGLAALGLRVGEVVGKSLQEYFQTDDPDDPAIAAHRRALLGKSVEWEALWAGRVYQAHTEPLRNAQGEIEGVLGIALDVTDRARAQERLVEQERRLDLALRGAELGLWDWDIEHDRTVINERWASMLGYGMEELDPVSRHFDSLVHPDDLPRVKAALRAHLEQRTPVYEMEHRMRTRGGEWRWVLARGQVYERTSSGRALRAAGTHLDITMRKEAEAVRAAAEEERRRLQARMQQSQKLESLGVLAGGIAHDFNNLLTAILGNADLALSETSPASPVHGYLKDIETSSQRAAELCHRMLAYSGRGQFILERLDLREAVKQVAPMLEVAAGRDMTIEYEYDHTVPLVDADLGQIQQVITHLVTNAAEAIGEAAGTITVRVTGRACDRAFLSTTYVDDELPEGRYALLQVRDTGGGVDRDTHERLFEPFFTTKFTGRGLGLPAVLGIVRGHRGAVKVESVRGQGTSVSVLLPAADGEPPVVAPPPASGRRATTVLLVDDEEMVRTAARRMLEKMGYEVIVARDGVQAVELFRAQPDRVAVVLLDLTMPRMDGAACFHKLRRIRPDVRVVMSSGYDEREVSDRFASEGVAGFVHKPYQRTTLETELQRVLRS